jgi:hypothetical protein
MSLSVVMAVVVPAAGAVHVGSMPMIVVMVVVQVFTVDLGVVRAAAASHAHGFLLGNGVSM